MSTVLEKAKKAYLDVLMESSPEYLTKVADALHANTVEWGKTMGMVSIPESNVKMSPAKQIGLMLSGISASYRTLVPLLAKAFSLILEEEVVYSSCGNATQNAYVRTSQDKWVCVVPTVNIGVSSSQNFPIGEVVLFRQVGNRSNINITNYNKLGLVSSSYAYYQTQSRLPSKSEILTYLLELSLMCPEVIATVQEDLGLVVKSK